MKLFNNTNIAFLTSLFILVSVIYSFIVQEPIFEFTSLLHYAISTVAIITIGIHINALKENNDNQEKKKIILFSLAIPIAVIIYFIAGIIYLFTSELDHSAFVI